MNQLALQKIKHFCAYQERSHQEVRSKLLELKIYGLELENILTILIDENYLNEERFARERHARKGERQAALHPCVGRRVDVDHGRRHALDQRRIGISEICPRAGQRLRQDCR